MKTVTIYTDGACSGNPGPGGWCAILQYGANEKQLSGGEANTTNNRMELTAVIEALRQANGFRSSVSTGPGNHRNAPGSQLQRHHHHISMFVMI